MRITVMALLLIALVVGSEDSLMAGKRHRHRHHRPASTALRWPLATTEILIVNHSPVALEDVEAAVRMWDLPGVPALRVVQADVRPCSAVLSQPGVVALCVDPDMHYLGFTTYTFAHPQPASLSLPPRTSRSCDGCIRSITRSPRS